MEKNIKTTYSSKVVFNYINNYKISYFNVREILDDLK